jgi:O-antigen/teichoic acid export membrane protein
MASQPEESPRVARSAGLALMTYVVTASFTAVITLFLIRRLGPGEFGVYSLAMGIASLAMLPADFGIAQSAGRFIAERRGDRGAVAEVLGAAMRMKLMTGLAVAVALAALAGPLADAYDEDALTWTLRAMAVAMFAQTMLILYLEAFISVGRLGTNLRIVTVESSIEAGATITLVLASSGAAAAAGGRAIGYVVGFAVALLFVARAFGRGAITPRRVPGGPAIARYAGVMLIVNGVYSVFTQVDVLLIGALLSTVAVGQFSAPMRVFVLLYYPGLAVTSAVAPRMTRGEGTEPDVSSFRFALRLLIVLHAAMVPPLLIWAEPIVDLLLGADYEESIDVVRVLAPLVLVQGVGPLLAVSVNYLGEAGRRVPIAIAAVLVNVVIDLALLREIGIVAGAIGTLVGFTVYVIGHAVICHRLLDLQPRVVALTVARSLLAATAMAGVLLLFGTADVSIVQMLAGMLLGLAVYGAALVLTRELGGSELRWARSVIRLPR